MEQPDLTKLYNEKIALWMGLKNVCVHPKFGVYEAEDEHGYIDWVDVGIRSLDYHRNWNLLMPVVEKIENTLKEYENKDVSWLYWNNVFDGYVNSKIGITYDSIIGFIEWYNSLTPSLKQ